MYDSRQYDYEIELLRELNGEDRGLVPGAAMWAAVESLRSKGLAQGLTKITITEEGKEFLERFGPWYDDV